MRNNEYRTTGSTPVMLDVNELIITGKAKET
jgi:hypothetical protein